MLEKTIEWLLENGSEPVKYRTERDIKCLKGEKLVRIKDNIFDDDIAKNIVSKQKSNSTWNDVIYFPNKNSAATETTFSQFGKLCQLGYDQSDNVIGRCAQDVLFPLLEDSNKELWELTEIFPTEDKDVFEFTKYLLRDISLLLLAMAGYYNDLRYQKALKIAIGEQIEFFTRFSSKKPYSEENGKLYIPITVYPPTIFLLTALSYVGNVRKDALAIQMIYPLYDYMVKEKEIPPYYIKTSKGDIKHEYIAKLLFMQPETQDNLLAMLMDLEVAASLGIVDNIPVLKKKKSELIKERNSEGFWEMELNPYNFEPNFSFYYPINSVLDGNSKYVDATFRLAHIEKMAEE